jgi:hypothetical protein
MIVVAVVGLACAARVLLLERRERFARLARQHSSAPPVTWPTCATPGVVERQRFWSKLSAAWHAEMAQKYQHAARYPWLPVAPDPPEPEGYFASITSISTSGPIRSGQFPFDIIVVGAPDSGAIGMAFGTGRTNDGLARWRLTVHGIDVPGQWVIVDREFRPVKERPENPRPRW